MTPETTLAWEVVLWMVFAIGIILLRIRTHQRSVGLIIAYIANLWMIHWPSALTYLFPWYFAQDSDLIMLGFQQAFYGIIGLGIGAVGLGPLLVRVFDAPGSHSREAVVRRPSEKLPMMYIFIGVFSFLVLTPILGRIQTVAAIAQGTNQLVVVGFSLFLWHAWWAKRMRRFFLGVLAACALPLVTIATQGFLSYGAVALISIVTFLTVFVRPRWLLAFGFMILLYVGFSFYVTYMRDRADIRASVWGGQSVGDRMSTMSSTVTRIEWFDPKDPLHLMRVNARLNQNYLVGAAVRMLNAREQSFATGQTVFDALLAVIPRAIWPDKPTSAGSGTIVTTYTGISFAANTSVGVGQVMEFYINFGFWGVIIGFIIFGAVLTVLDTWAAQRLWQGDWLQFAVWYLPGLAMMQAGGSLVEVISSAAAAIVAVLLTNRYLVGTTAGTRYSVPAP